MNDTVAENLFSKELRAGLEEYKIVARWMFVSYIAAVLFTILIGLTALISRLGSFATIIVSAVNSLFLLAFALTAESAQQKEQ